MNRMCTFGAEIQGNVYRDQTTKKVGRQGAAAHAAKIRCKPDIAPMLLLHSPSTPRCHRCFPFAMAAARPSNGTRCATLRGSCIPLFAILVAATCVIALVVRFLSPRASFPFVFRGKQPHSKVAVISCDNRPLEGSLGEEPYSALSAVLVAEYANRHGYDYWYYRPFMPTPDSSPNKFSTVAYHPLLNASRATSWAKLVAVWAAVVDGGYDYVLFVDSDAMIVELDTPLEAIMLNHTRRVSLIASGRGTACVIRQPPVGLGRQSTMRRFLFGPR